eukprot:tig00000204_g17707.t1
MQVAVPGQLLAAMSKPDLLAGIPVPPIKNCTQSGELPKPKASVCLDQTYLKENYPAKPYGTFDIGRMIADMHNKECTQGSWSFKVPVPILANATYKGDEVTASKPENPSEPSIVTKVDRGAANGLKAWREKEVACCNPKKFHYAIQDSRGDVRCTNGKTTKQTKTWLAVDKGQAPKGTIAAIKAKMGLKHVESYSAHVSEAAFVDEGDFAADAGALEGDAAQDGAGADESAADAPDAALAAFDSSEHLL